MTFQLYKLARPFCRASASIDWVAITVSILDTYRDTRLILCLLINRLAYNLPAYLLAILEAKLRIICRIEGSP